MALSACAWGQSSSRSDDAADEAVTMPAESEWKTMISPPSDPSAVPITLPTTAPAYSERKPMLPSGIMIIGRVASIENDPAGQWKTIKDPKVGVLYLLPCESLEAVEDALAENPKATFNLSGEVHRYRGGYYMLLHRAMLIDERREAAASSAPADSARTTQPVTAPAVASAPAEPPGKSDTEAISQPADDNRKKASADDVANELLSETPVKPIVPVIQPKQPDAVPAPSGAPLGKPLEEGAGKNAIHRLARLLPATEERKWSRLAFETDNTLQEPPVRALPSPGLERMEILSNNGTAFGAVFHISGEIHRYRGKDYILLREVIKKRDMGQF